VKFVSFRAECRPSYGILWDGGVHDLGARLGTVLPSLRSYLHAISAGLSPQPGGASQIDYAHGEFTYDPVITDPGKILCVGLNYEEHRKETGRPEAAYPSIFTRFADTLIGHDVPIRLPAVSSALDYEGELAVVIGKAGFRIAEDEAEGHIAGYACFNDATLRDWQRHTHQFIPGKNFPATGAFGPFLVTPDELGKLEPLSIGTCLSSETMQSATLGDMIFSVPRIIAYVSGFTPLSPGDVIATGTPGGVGFKREPQRFMALGEIVEVSIDGLGTLRNTIAAEAADR